MIAAAVIVTRWLLFSAVLVLFGSSLFLRYGPGVGHAGTTDARWPSRLTVSVAAIALLASVLWLMAKTASLSGEGADAVRWSVLTAVVSATHFGLLGALRVTVLALLVVKLLWLPAAERGGHTPLVLGAVLTASFGWTGHGAMNDDWAGVLHRGADVAHLLAAAAWIGALVPLCILAVRAHGGNTHDAFALHEALEHFSGIGPAVVALLLGTGLINTWFLVGPEHWRALVTSGYGRTLCVKLVLFALMLLLAAANRLRLAPQLGANLGVGARSGDTTAPVRMAGTGGAGGTAALARLRTSLLTETALALLVLAAVALLGTLEPPVSG